MALLMVHLAVAERFAAIHPEYADIPEFYLGVISPDAIHERDGGDKSRKDFYHLYNWQSPDLKAVADYWRVYRSPFDVGFGVHVLTDAQWVPKFRKIDGLMQGGRLDREQYYHDTFLTDFELFEREKFAERMLPMLEKAVPPTDHPLLTAEEFSGWRDGTVRTYRKPCRESGKQKYIDLDYVDRFFEECMPMIDEAYRKSFPAE